MKLNELPFFFEVASFVRMDIGVCYVTRGSQYASVNTWAAEGKHGAVLFYGTLAECEAYLNGGLFFVFIRTEEVK